MGLCASSSPPPRPASPDADALRDLCRTLSISSTADDEQVEELCPADSPLGQWAGVVLWDDRTETGSEGSTTAASGCPRQAAANGHDHISELDLHRRHLAGSLPDTGIGASRFPHLRSLDLSGNTKLTGPFPSDLDALPDGLQYLSLANTAIRGPIPAAMMQALDARGSLRTINLSACKGLSCEAPHVLIRMAQSVAAGGSGVTVRTRGCKLRLPADEAGWETHLAALTELRLPQWGLAGTIPKAGLRRCTALRVLDLSGCGGLTGLVPDVFGAGGGVGGAEIGAGIGTGIGSVLEEVNLSSCRGLTGPLPLFRGCARLRVLDMSGCRRLTGGLPRELSQCTSLQTLDLSHCEALDALGGVVAVPAAIGFGCTALEVLDVSTCWSLEGDLPLSLGLLMQRRKRRWKRRRHGGGGGGENGGEAGGDAGDEGGNGAAAEGGSGDDGAGGGGAAAAANTGETTEEWLPPLKVLFDGSCLEFNPAAALAFAAAFGRFNALLLCLRRQQQQRVQQRLQQRLQQQQLRQQPPPPWSVADVTAPDSLVMVNEIANFVMSYSASVQVFRDRYRLPDNMGALNKRGRKRLNEYYSEIERSYSQQQQQQHQQHQQQRQPYGEPTILRRLWEFSVGQFALSTQDT